MNNGYAFILFALVFSPLAYSTQANQTNQAKQSTQTSKATQPSLVTAQQLLDIITNNPPRSDDKAIMSVQSQHKLNDVDAKFTNDDVNRDSSNDVVTETYSHIGDNFASWLSHKLHTASLANGEGKKMLAAELEFTEVQTTKLLQVIHQISEGRNKVNKQIKLNRCKRFAQQSKVNGEAIAIEGYIDDVRNNTDISEYYHQQLIEFADSYPQLEQDLAHVYESYPITITDMTPADYDWLSSIKESCGS